MACCRVKLENKWMFDETVYSCCYYIFSINCPWNTQDAFIFFFSRDIFSSVRINRTFCMLFATSETRRELKPKCVSQLFLASLLVTRRSAIDQFYSLSLVTVPEVFAKVTPRPSFFFSRLFSGELSVNEFLCFASCLFAVRRLPSPSRPMDSDDVSETNSHTRSYYVIRNA